MAGRAALRAPDDAGARQRPLGRWALAAGVWAIGVVTHELIQVVYRHGSERWGVAGFDARQAVVYAGVGAPALLACVVAAHARRGARGSLVWAAWAGVSALAFGVLAQTRAELVHLPQYAVVAWLVGGCVGGRGAGIGLLALVAGLGFLDELYQYMVLYRDRYMDWNDVVLNTLGGVAGVLARWTWR